MPARRPSLIRRLITGVVAAATVASVIALAPAVAHAAPAPAAEPAPAAGAGASGPQLTGAWGQDLVFEQAAQPIGPRQLHYRLSPQPDGSVMFITDGACLDSEGPFSIAKKGLIAPWDCRDVPSQKFYIVPQNHTPHSAPHMSRGDQYFYIVSAATNQCIWSAVGGLNFTGELESQSPRLLPCSEGDVGQEFRIYDEQPNPDGVYNEWQNLLNQAVIYATNHCAADYASCEVSSPNAPTPNGWYRPNDDAVGAFGTLSTQSLGCGVGTTINGVTYSPTVTNNTLDNQTKTVGAQLSLTKSTQVTETLGYTFSLETSGGLKDVWGVKVTNGFSYNHQAVKGSSTTESTSDTISSTVRPGDTLMATWSGSVYNITGTWKFGENIPVLDPANRTLRWTMPATSSYPVTVDNQAIAHLSSVTSRYPKNCDASAPAAQHPGSVTAITTADGFCTAPVSTPATVSTGTTLKACPGEWDVPVGKGSSDTNFIYQWYVVGPDGTARQNIEGATGSTFTVQPSTYSAATPNLGVAIFDAGNPDRLESRPAVVAPVKVIVNPPALGDPVDIATNFVGSVDDAQTGAPYSAPLVAHPGSDLHLSWSALPDGLSISADGVLSGTPTAPGAYDIEITDTPAAGPVQTQTVQLLVYDPQAVFRDDAQLTATVGTPFAEALVPVVPTGLSLVITDGALPDGLAFDGATGELTGTPTVAGTSTITVQDADAPGTYGVVTIVVGTVAPAFAGTALPAGKVGAAYQASAVASAGTGSLFALAAQSAVLPDGLSLNADTGAITGTPTAAANVAIEVVDLANPGPSYTATLVVAAADGTVPAGTPGALAATGSAAGGMLALAALLAAAGALALVLRRRRVRH